MVARFGPPTLLLLPLLTSACAPPPDAPEGLDESLAFMVRNAYADDATFNAGLVGLLDWFDLEGDGLVDVEAAEENVDRFTLADLDVEDLANLPLDPQILVDRGNQNDPDDDVYADRDPSLMQGTMSVALVDCHVWQAERVVTELDQGTVFEADWTSFNREFQTDQAPYVDSKVDETFAAVETGTDRATLLSGDPDLNSTFLLTDNYVDPKPIAFADIGEYLNLTDYRHGVFEVEGREMAVGMGLSYNPSAAWGGSGGNYGLMQSISLALSFEKNDGTTIRINAIWAEPVGPLVNPEGSLARRVAVNKSLGTSHTISEICSGE